MILFICKKVILLFIQLLFDCSIRLRVVYMAKSVFAMHTKMILKEWAVVWGWGWILSNVFIKVRAWIWFKIVIRKFRTPLEKNSSVMAVITLLVASIRWQFHTKQSQESVETGTGSHLCLGERWERYMTLFRWSFQTKIFITKTCNLMHIFIGTFLFSTKVRLPFAQCWYCPSTN